MKFLVLWIIVKINWALKNCIRVFGKLIYQIPVYKGICINILWIKAFKIFRNQGIFKRIDDFFYGSKFFFVRVVWRLYVKGNAILLWIKMNLEVIEISGALLFYNLDILNKDIYELLLQIMPNESEYNNIYEKTKNIANQEDISLCDLFILMTGECLAINKD